MNLVNLKVYWKRGWISFLISAVCFLYLLNFTWLKWGDLIVDLGREMYVPLELSSGKLLYRDVFYLYGPFSPYFNSLIFRIFGVHVYSLVLSGIITICAVGILIYKISRFFLNIFLSIFSVLTFLFIFAFGHYTYYANFNFILPYSYAAIHGIMFSLATLHFFYLSLFKKADGYKFFYCIFLTTTFLCRIEIGIMLIASITISLGIYFISQREAFKKTLFQSLTYLILPVGCAVLVYSLFFIAAGNIVQKSNLFDIWLGNMNIKRYFTNWLLGGLDISGNTLEIFKTFLYYIFFCIFFALGGFIVAYISNLKRIFYRIFSSFLIGIVFVWLGFILFRKFFTMYNMQYKCLPLICLLAIFISLRRFIKKKDRIKNLFIITISFFSLFLMFRMLFHVWAGHYGFYILVPGIIIYYVFFLKIVPEVLNSNIARVFFNFGYIFIFTLFIISHFNISRFCYKQRTLKISSRRGNLYVFNSDREHRLKELIDFLDENTDEKDSLIVFPEGLALNFLSERKNPLYYYTYLPVDLVETGVADEIISAMEDKKIGYVVITQRKTYEYGYGIFGKDYGREIFKYILENYTLFKQFGPFPFTSKSYGIALFKRKT